jgi:hypothetical protein
MGIAQETEEKALRQFEEIYKKFKNRTAFKIRFKVSYYSDSSSNTPMKSFDGSLCRQADQFYSQIGQQEQLANDEHYIQVDHQSRAIHLKPRNRAGPDREMNHFQDGLPLGSLDSFQTFFSKISHERLDATTAAFWIKMDASRYKGLYYVYHSAKEVPERIELYLQGKAGQSGSQGKLVITYKDITFDPDYQKGFFKSSRYVLKEGKSYKSVSEFKAYNVIQ